jgi:hypothetical protein
MNSFSNYAFIDSQNLNLSVKDQGWRLDYKRFRRYLQDKYGVAKAFVFIGYMPTQQALYTALPNSELDLPQKDMTLKFRVKPHFIHRVLGKQDHRHPVFSFGSTSQSLKCVFLRIASR